MKRFWLVLLSLGLIMAFSVSAYAVDVKFSGTYEVAGRYLDKTSLVKDAGVPSAFYNQRFRVKSEFIVSPGLSVITRADILERAWGVTRSAATTTLDSLSAGSRAENENIAFDAAYLSYTSGIGTFWIGMQPGGPWGTQFGDTTTTKNRIAWISPTVAGFTFLALTDKTTDKSYTAINTTEAQADHDSTAYGAAFIYASKVFQVHGMWAYVKDASNRTAAPAAAVLAPYVYTGYKAELHNLVLATIVNAGPVKVQAEVIYFMGTYREFEPEGFTALKKVNSLAAWINAKGTFGPVYVGGTVAYSQGQSDQDYTKDTLNQVASGGSDWNPCLIMFNYDLTYWQGSSAGAGTMNILDNGIKNTMSNAWLFQVEGGFNVTAKMTIGASVTYAMRDTVLANYEKTLGTEIDVTGTYKITNNLSYMLGAAYLITGDFYKGVNKSGEVQNDYLLINKLTLTF